MFSFRLAARDSFILTLWSFCLIALVGGLIAWEANGFRPTFDPTIPHQSSFYLYTFTRFEPSALYLFSAFLLACTLFVSLGNSQKAPHFRLLASIPLWLPVAAIVFLAATVGRLTIYQNFDLCIDEALNDFEARIMEQHHLGAAVPEKWQGFTKPLSMGYTFYNPAGHYWDSGFLPGFAFLDYLFRQISFDWALSPLLAALSIGILWVLAMRIFPDTGPVAGNIAILLLACSPQFMANAMTKFSWTAHLCGTLTWLWLFTHPNRYLFLLTPIFGALLIGLHQPHVHVLIAAPFIFRLALDRRWRAFAWFCLCYLVGAFIWYKVLLILRAAPPLAAGGDMGNLTQPPTHVFITVVLSLLFCVFHGLTALAWSTPLLLPCMTLAVISWKNQPAIIRDALLAVGLTFFFYLLTPRGQGHGWGFRYLHSAYGLMALVAAGGAVTLLRQGLQKEILYTVIASALFSLAIQFPYRASEIRSLVRPLALTWDYISHQKCDFVILKTSDFWYSWDLIRNDPWLQQKPFVFNNDQLTQEQRALLYSTGTVRVIGADDVARFGVIVSDPAKKPKPQ